VSTNWLLPSLSTGLYLLLMTPAQHHGITQMNPKNEQKALINKTIHADSHTHTQKKHALMFTHMKQKKRYTMIFTHTHTKTHALIFTQLPGARHRNFGFSCLRAMLLCKDMHVLPLSVS
jgi:hypothetical protein